MAVGENDGYDTILHKISRYDTIIRSQNALPYVMVNSPRLMQHSHWCLSTRSHAFKRHQRSTAFERCPHCRTPLTMFNACEREDGLIALLDFSSVFTDVRTSLTTFERQWEVHLRLHSSRPSKRICRRRPGTACIWVWPHTGWTTTLVPNRLRGNYSDIWYDAIRIQYRDIRYDTMYRAITKLFWGIMLHFLDIFIH